MEKSGQRHPGSHVNKEIKNVLKNPATAAVYRLSSADVCELDVNHPGNFAVVNQLIEDHVINTELVKGDRIYVYSIHAANIAIKSMLGDPSFNISESDVTFDFSFRNVEVSPVTAEFKKKRYYPSLIDRLEDKDMLETAHSKRKKNRKNFKPKSVLESMSEQDQEAVRRYCREVRETRNNGRPYRKRGGNQ